MVPKENHRERVLTDDEEAKYLGAATAIGEGIQEAYQRALCGIRAAQRGEQPTEPRDPFLLRDVATTLLDCALRPEECFRLRWEQGEGRLAPHPARQDGERPQSYPPVRPGRRRRVDRRQGEQPRRGCSGADESGHIEKSSLKKQHQRAIKESKVPAFVLYECRHTCLTRWAEHMDPTLSPTWPATPTSR